MTRTPKFLGRVPSALLVAFLMFGTANAPGVALIPTVGGQALAGGCGNTIHGCGRDQWGQPCGVADGTTCFYDEMLSLYDVNNLADFVNVQSYLAEQFGWNDDELVGLLARSFRRSRMAYTPLRVKERRPSRFAELSVGVR